MHRSGKDDKKERGIFKVIFTESNDNRMLGQERSYVSRNPPDAAGYFKIA